MGQDSHNGSNKVRKINPNDISLPHGFKIDVFAEGLTTPINLIITDNEEMLVADAGVATGNGKVLKLINGKFQVIAEGFNPPLTGITYHKGDIYVAHRGFITVIKPDGTKVDIVSGLPSWGDHHNNRIIFGIDGKMYFGQGTATNSGVVGKDNEGWVKNYPFFHDYPGSTIELKGYNFMSENFLSEAPYDKTCTGAYSPFGVPNKPNELVKGITRTSGSILRANPDGSYLELVAWGLRNPFRMKFDRFNRLFSTNHGMDIRGSRPVANSPDEFHLVQPGTWYGWPDYTGGLPITLPVFKPDDEPQPSFIIGRHPMIPPKPLAVFTPHSAIMGFDFSYNSAFCNFGDVYIAEFGSEAPRTTGGKPLPGVGHRVSRIDIHTGKVYTFAINKSGYAASHTDDGGFERPIDILFGSDATMFIVDFGLTGENGHHEYIPETGVIWKVIRI
ncbi:MAG: sorbosone dehydrogenase family protein [Clostridia bacterium]